MIGIYKITSPSGKIYIGQSINIESRLKSYASGWGQRHSLRLARSIKKYGWLNHNVEILIECNQSELNAHEERFINEYNSFNPNTGLNLRSGGNSQLNSKETRFRMSLAQKGKLVRPETKQKIRAANIGTIRPLYVKEKISRSMKCLVKSDIHKQNISKAIKSSEKFKSSLSQRHAERRKKVIDLSTGKVYESIKDLIKSGNTSYSYSNITAKLAGAKNNNTTFKYYI